jgi:hypothetical protein
MDETVYEARDIYFTLKKVRELDAELIKMVENDGVKLREGINKMRKVMKEKYRICTPDQNYCTPPNVAELNYDEILVTPGRCDVNNVRFIVVKCFLKSPGKEAAYSVRTNGNAFPSYSGITLQEAMSCVEILIYGKTL